MCKNGLPRFEMKSCLFPAATSEILRNLICIFFGCFKTKKNGCIHVISVMSKYFQMLPIQILPPLLFRTDFPGYRGLQYVHDFLVFWVVSNFFKRQKPNYSRHGLPVNSHASFTYSFPTLKIILIPTMTRSNRFWFFSLDAHTCPPHAKVTILICDIDLLVVRHTSKNTSGSLEPFVLGCAHCWQKAIIYYLGCAHYWQKLSTVEKSSRHCQGTEYQHK